MWTDILERYKQLGWFLVKIEGVLVRKYGEQMRLHPYEGVSTIGQLHGRPTLTEDDTYVFWFQKPDDAILFQLIFR